MFDNIHIMDTLRKAGFEAGEITVTSEPGVRDVTITRVDKNPETGEAFTDIPGDASRALAAAGYDILCYGGRVPGVSLATLLVRMPKATKQVA